MEILAIETSCDETAISILEISGNKNISFKVLSNIVSSQVKIHSKYGGVVPALAAREHTKNLKKVLKLSLEKSKIKNLPDLICVTIGPGLLPALLIGVNFAKSLSYFLNLPILGVNHLEGHLYSSFLKADEGGKFKVDNKDLFPALGLIISGGHTELVYVKNVGNYQIIGRTLDDAVGESFDKVSRLLNLGYPGGPIIDKIAKEGDFNKIKFPIPLINSKDYNFSYSGLKTAVLYYLRDNHLDFSKKMNSKLLKIQKDIAASFEKAAIEVLLKKTIKAANDFKVKTILIGGGVSANSYLQARFQEIQNQTNFKILFPKKEFITDNAAMIGLAGYLNYKLLGKRDDLFSLDAQSNLNF
ncbi:MAG TPA: tRNA (adenosine(37)-N6)-threonylcarbamoyltransferase complex transferase subunit TsaD [Candidatus Paceibacterota bacterium]|nr:tRNA (adenosine(37)-N6)-threonylcarbamoyltransferase complex transferase subunit TsaD [Candidatus Paceibacterota bacterium]